MEEGEEWEENRGEGKLRGRRSRNGERREEMDCNASAEIKGRREEREKGDGCERRE